MESLLGWHGVDGAGLSLEVPVLGHEAASKIRNMEISIKYMEINCLHKGGQRPEDKTSILEMSKPALGTVDPNGVVPNPWGFISTWQSVPLCRAEAEPTEGNIMENGSLVIINNGETLWKCN